MSQESVDAVGEEELFNGTSSDPSGNDDHVDKLIKKLKKWWKDTEEYSSKIREFSNQIRENCTLEMFNSKAATSTINKMVGSREEMLSICHELKFEFESLKNERDRLRLQLEEVKKSKEESEKETIVLRQQLDIKEEKLMVEGRLNKEINDRVDKRLESDKLEEKLMKIKEENECLKEQVETMKKVLDKQTSDVLLLQEELEESVLQTSKYSSKHMEDDKRALVRKLKVLSTEKEMLLVLLKGRAQKINKTEERFQEKLRETEKLKEQIADLENKSININRIYRETMEMSKKIQSENLYYNNIAKEIGNAALIGYQDADRMNLTKQIQTLKQKLMKKSEQLVESQEKLKDKERQMEDIKNNMNQKEYFPISSCKISLPSIKPLNLQGRTNYMKRIHM
ncbi:putative leucine-rich repeat-containing protein DDB_G0290503 isoform X2 [Centruroides sculpturatus]|uniref:putative leucine-rich repeat-containing protein DDB_G0290503 isoform X2 n=1 Tax=Centruroides sculpturatus TaxID=218467 RepID=UPI000C6DD1B2|nr:putative leucine-rich repeat-containing protein DDB_G0290503 isoform X2 [Centruroides sculpturatus]